MSEAGAPTLPGLLRALAASEPERVIAEDGAAAPALTDRPARRLTAAALWDAATLTARRLRDLGLAPGEAVIISLPNQTDSLIAIFGVMLAGGRAAPLPVFEPAPGLAEAASLIGAVGILTTARFSGLRPAEQARYAAAACIDVRFVCAFGEDLPAGVTPLDGWSPECGADPVMTGGALITFDHLGVGLRAFERDGAQVVRAAAGLAALIAPAGGAARLLATLPPTSAAGCALVLALPLIHAAPAMLDPLFDSCRFADALGDGAGALVALPGAAEDAFHAHCAARMVRHERLILVHRPAVTEALPALADVSDAVDMICLGEAAMIVRRRGASDSDGLALMARGKRLFATGPLAPRRLGVETAGDEAGVDTGFAASFLEALVPAGGEGDAKAARSSAA